MQVSLACSEIVCNHMWYQYGTTYLCETGIGNPFLDSQRYPVVKAGNSLKLERRGQGGGDEAREDQKHHCSWCFETVSQIAGWRRLNTMCSLSCGLPLSAQILTTCLHQARKQRFLTHWTGKMGKSSLNILYRTSLLEKIEHILLKIYSETQIVGQHTKYMQNTIKTQTMQKNIFSHKNIHICMKYSWKKNYVEF